MTDGYEGIYDSREHGITMNPLDEAEDYTVYYSTVPLSGSNYREEGSIDMPTFADIGEYTIYYYIVSEHYYSVSGSDQVIITERSVAEEKQNEKFELSMNALPDVVYDGTAKEPDLEITAHYTMEDQDDTVEKNVRLKKDEDYVLTYENNTAAGTATVTVQGIGNYNEVMTKTFRILPREVTLCWSQNKFLYDGNEKSVTAIINNKALPSDDVTVGTYENHRKTEAGIYRAKALALTGANAENYYIGDNSQAECVWSIEKVSDTSENLTTAISAETLEKNALALNAGLKVSQTGSKINVAWGRVADADGYEVYVQYCGKKFTKKSLNSVNSGKVTKITVKKVNSKKLNLKKNYKIYVIAYKMEDGKKVTLGKTITVHIVGKNNTKYTNVKAVKVKKNSYSLKVGKTAVIEASTVLVSPDKKQLSNNHANEFRYATSDKSIATVSAKGKIKAVGKGTCIIYVYARNGYAKKVKVTVK